MTPSVRRLTFLALIAACLMALGIFTAAPAAATHGRLSATRNPGGTVPAGSTVTVTATIENADPDIELLDATLNAPLDPVLSPYVSLVTGSVIGLVARAGLTDPRHHHFPATTRATPASESTSTSCPAGQHIDVEFKVTVASRLPAGVDTTGSRSS